MDTLPLELFLQALGDPSLYESAQYLRVNRRWFHFLSPRIWKHAADHRLLNIQPHRRQLLGSRTPKAPSFQLNASDATWPRP
ncbi:hypothetical protein ASPCAL01768 [Aspergillus calidoustus]|uniref:F-box domain-containing protein n=1 Tax=Aspergillus calidoustus TaxID=454130 RepID=A0A0U5CLJ1_ASPCI|nr:hypothetical protein ASPCAL01768 [Aspergillus calidoustus]